VLARVAVDQHRRELALLHDPVQRVDPNLELVARDAILLPPIGADHDAGMHGAHSAYTAMLSSSAMRSDKASAPAGVITTGSPHIR
jgi:hypothetical protein